MAVPLSLASRVTVMVCMAIIPFASFYGAYVFDENSRIKNIISIGIGLLAIGGLGVVIVLNT